MTTELTAGDKVIVLYTSMGSARYGTATVTRATQAFVFVQDAVAFGKHGGIWSKRFARDSAVPWAQALEDELRRLVAERETFEALVKDKASEALNVFRSAAIKTTS